MAEKLIKIVITGAESTGKSTLSEVLAIHFKAERIPEFSRAFIENLNRDYDYSDVEIIARQQIVDEQNIDPEISLIFFDTWLIITLVWFEFVYGKSPVWLHEYILQSKIDLLLVCDIDIPWVPDAVRENGGENRSILQKIYLDKIREYGFPFHIVSGFGDERKQNAIDIVDQYLAIHKK